MTFVVRKFEHRQCLGEKLKALRKEAGFTLTDMIEKTKIQRPYLEALESGDYQDLPDPIYAKNFLKVYLKTLRADPAYYLNLFEGERATCNLIDRTCLPRQRARSSRFFVLSRFAKFASLGLVALAITGYIGLEVRQVITPPALAIEAPVDGYETDDASITITGDAEPGTRVTINNEHVLLSANGTFSYEMILERGVNLITVEGSKRYSRTTSKERRVLLRQTTPLGRAY